MLALIFSIAVSATAAATPDEIAVRDAENKWSAAYVTGDGAFLNALLADSYVSVSGKGVDHAKADIVAGAVSYAKDHPGTAATPMPASSTIDVTGDIAIVRHHAPESVSVDVFQKRDGAWIALYSQHTAISAEK